MAKSRAGLARGGQIESEAEMDEKTNDESHYEDDHEVEGLVQARTAELTDVIGYLSSTHEDERRRLARELHDELGSILTAAKLDISFIKSKFGGANKEMIAKCERIASMLDEGAALKRRLIDLLHPSTLEMLGLGSAVRELVENFSEDSKVAIECDVDNDIDHNNSDALTVYRVIQEALANVSRHAKATTVHVTLQRSGDRLHVVVRDDGDGFDPVVLSRPPRRGLSAMKQRVRALEGTLRVDSA
ncbi:MAG: sensor histidine kinase, partial [Betaproteobacteria bacterium]